MLSGVGVICFAASYMVAFVLELTRLFFRSGIRGAVMIGFAAAGLLAHSAYLYYQLLDASGSTLSSQRDWYFIAAWALVVLYLYLTYFHPKTPLGVFVLPLVLGLIGVGQFLADPEPFARESASALWGTVHGIAILLVVVSISIGFAAALMYFIQAHRLKTKRPSGSGPRLPSLEWLQRANARSMLVSMLLLAVGILSGKMLITINATERVPFSDPVILGTLGLFAWLFAAVIVDALYKPARSGRKIALQTVFSFALLIALLGIMLFSNSDHGGSRRAFDEQNPPLDSVSTTPSQTTLSPPRANAPGGDQ
ncbi:MAG: cytochrome c biogenesis protein CcsA [Pirellulales bacterium]|nr:cytochrome c biogenesis protein CcsA [Pirellulales bacterium]